MNLPFSKKPKNPSDEHEQFFALQISPEVVKSAIWAIYNGKPQVISVGASAHWDNQSLDSLISGADQTVSDTIARLGSPDKVGPQKVVFGLPPDWVTDDKIIPTRLDFIKNLSVKLSLKPVGFVVSSQALIQHILTLEGVPPTAILLGFWPQVLEITVVRLGKNEGSFLISRSQNPLEDVIEGLYRFGHLDMLPSRMLLYDSGVDLEDTRQLLLSHPWLSPQKRLPFLHFPKIESLAPDFSIRSIALSGGSEVAHALGLITDKPADTQDLGFTEHTPAEVPVEPVEAEEVYIPLPQQPKSYQPRTPLLLGIITAIITLLAGLTAAYWYLPRARVVLTIDPKTLNHDFQLTADTKIAKIDLTNLAIPALVLDTSVSDEKSTPATGVKTIGDKATATVTVCNGTPDSHKFAAGTLLTSPSGLKYQTADTITVASASGTTFNLVCGKAQTKAMASTIGPDYNLASGATFRVASYSVQDIAAQNDTDFSGGTSQKVKAISKDDIAKLRSSLTDDLKAKARDQLQKKVPADQTLIPESITVDPPNENFDHKLDDQADDLKLNLTIKSHGLIVSNSDLSQIIDSQTTSLVPPGYLISSDKKQTFQVKKADKAGATFQVSFSASLLPKIDDFTVTKNLAGKTTQAAHDYLSNIPGVATVDFFITPVLPKFLALLPHLSKNIKIEIQVKK